MSEQTGEAGKKRRRRLPVPARLALGLLVALIILGGVELSLRLAGIHPAFEMPWKGGWLGSPNLKNFQQRTHENPRGFLLNTNHQGLRSTLSEKRTPKVLRLAVMGDSTAYGWGVDDGYTLTDAMGRSFKELGARWAGGATRVELLNGAQPGYTTAQVAWLFEKVVAAYRPDWVLVFLPLHDHNLVLVSDKESIAGGDGLRAVLRVTLSRHVRIYTLLRRQLYPQHEQHYLMPDAETSEFRVPRVSDTERQQSLDRMRAILEKWGGGLMVGMLPTYIDLTDPPGSAPANRLGDDWLIRYARQQKVPLVDIRACCGPNAEQATLPNDKGHLSAMGNDLVGRAAAEEIAPYLRGSRK